MAFNFPGKKFFSGTDAKTRIFFLVAGVIGVGLLVYLGARFLGGGPAATTGPSKVAGTPTGLQSVPGGQVSPEYLRALEQANLQSAQKAQMTGASAVPTLINVPGQPTGTGECTVLCPSDETANVLDDLNNLVRSGKLSQNDADALAALAKQNLSVDEYAAALAELVRQGKLTPEQARALLEKYKKQHQNTLLSESANAMDGLIKSGQLPLDVANQLLDLQKRKLTPAEYAAELARLVREGKLSPEAAAALLAQYTQQYQKEKAKGTGLAIREMAKKGQITPDVAKILEGLASKNIPVDQYKAALDKLVADGKLTPAGAAKLLEQYSNQRTGIGREGVLGDMLSKGGAYADAANRLLGLQANNASLNDFADELKRMVAAGLISPEDAAELLRLYQAMLATPTTGGVTPSVDTNIPTSSDFAKLAERVQTQPPPTVTVTPPPQPPAPPAPEQAAQLAAAEQAAAAQAAQERQQRIQAIKDAMSNQAQSLVSAWQPPAMQHREGSYEIEKTTVVTTGPSSGVITQEKTTTTTIIKPSLIKSGTIYFAVLETAVDSDYPDTPVMATIVQGPFTGAKLIGKLALAQGMDRISLNFTQMDMTAWPMTRSISAFAIDPDTARTVMASEVDHHYLMRYGAIMAAAFVSGYSNAITQEGTSTTGIFGTSSTHPSLSPGNKIAVGIGQIGTALTSTFQTWINTPTTVKITAGVGIGILFTAEVTE